MHKVDQRAYIDFASGASESSGAFMTQRDANVSNPWSRPIDPAQKSSRSPSAESAERITGSLTAAIN